jgi:membrane protein implicated in regulation of membrane protease activity
VYLGKDEQMTQNNTQAELARIHRSMMIVALIDFPGALLFGLGIYGLVAGFDQDFLPILANQAVIVNIMLLLGAVIMAWGMFRMVMLAREKQLILQQRK